MREREIRSAREQAAEELGAAMLAAIELTVREYMLGQGEEFPPLRPKDGQTTEVSGGTNENFDLSRFYRLRGMAGAETAETTAEENFAAEESCFAAAAREKVPFPTAEERSFLPQLRAEEVSERFERDARRYDGTFREREEEGRA